MSSPQADQTIKQECLKFLRVLSPAYMTLPRSHYLNVNPRDLNPYASWGITETLEGRLNDKKVCVKTFWAQGAGNLDNVKKVCDSVRRVSEHHLTAISGSTLKSLCGSYSITRMWYRSLEFWNGHANSA